MSQQFPESIRIRLEGEPRHGARCTAGYLFQAFICCLAEGSAWHGFFHEMSRQLLVVMIHCNEQESTRRTATVWSAVQVLTYWWFFLPCSGTDWNPSRCATPGTAKQNSRSLQSRQSGRYWILLRFYVMAYNQSQDWKQYFEDWVKASIRGRDRRIQALSKNRITPSKTSDKNCMCWFIDSE